LPRQSLPITTFRTRLEPPLLQNLAGLKLISEEVPRSIEGVSMPSHAFQSFLVLPFVPSMPFSYVLTFVSCLILFSFLSLLSFLSFPFLPFVPFVPAPSLSILACPFGHLLHCSSFLSFLSFHFLHSLIFVVISSAFSLFRFLVSLSFNYVPSLLPLPTFRFLQFHSRPHTDTNLAPIIPWGLCCRRGQANKAPPPQEYQLN
jgi:hypothetical protein